MRWRAGCRQGDSARDGRRVDDMQERDGDAAGGYIGNDGFDRWVMVARIDG